MTGTCLALDWHVPGTGELSACLALDWHVPGTGELSGTIAPVSEAGQSLNEQLEEIGVRLAWVRDYL